MIAPAPHAPSEGLQWVRKELAATINDARNKLQKFSENLEDRTPLQGVAEQLHMAHGALRMVEVYGAALLVEEMVAVTTRLFSNASDSDEEALDALSRAIIQLPGYLDRVAGGGQDVPLVLLPLLNDLRAVRGSPLLSESSLFVLNVDQGAATPKRQLPSQQLDYRLLAKKIRPHYQKALLGWLKGHNLDNNLRVIGKALQKLEDGAATTPVYQFWWVLGGVVEAIIDDGLRPGASIKRLLGQADRELKMLAYHGETFYVKEPPRNMLNSLLYYVARAESKGSKVSAIKSSFSLSEVLQPRESGDDGEQILLQAPSVNLMKTVGAAIKQDVAHVKDAIDIFVRTKSTNHEELCGQRDSLKKLSDTLGVLGLDELRQQVAKENRRLHAYIEEGKSGEEDLLQIASTLIHVEAAIDEQLLGVIIPASDQATKQTLSTGEMAAAADRRQVTGAVLRECVVNLARIKESLSQFIDKPDGGGAALDAIPQLIKGIEAGLRMLDKSRAADLLQQVQWHISTITNQEDLALHTHELDRLADAIVSIEYYMDTVRSGRSEPDYMLDNAQTCLLAMKHQPDAAAPAPAPEPVDATAEHDVAEAQLEATGVREAARPARAALRPQSDGHLPPLDRPLALMDGRRADPELLELFIEEAKEEVASLRRSLPRWQQDNQDREVLLTMRRSFHTLKGSGHMVGANLIGEYAWGIENLINKLVSRSLVADDTLIKLVVDGINGLPQLIEQLEIGTAPSPALAELIDQAWHISETPQTVKEPEDPYATIMDAETGLVDSDEVAEQPAAASGPGAEQEHERTNTVEIAAAGADDQGSHAVSDVAPTVQPSAPEFAGGDSQFEESAGPAIVLDTALHEIFLKESLEHLGSVNAFIHDVAGQIAPVAVTDALHRAWHTLSGSANMAKVEAAAAIASPMNQHLRVLLAEGHPLNQEAVSILQRASTVFEEIVRGINRQPTLPDMQALLEDIERLPALGAAALSALQALEGSGEISLSGADTDTGPGYDPEIASIFAEEATELLEASDQALSGWFKEPAADSPKMLELLRHLHTLKGGARMARISAIGDLSHETESLVERIRDKELQLDGEAQQVLRQAFDRMHDMTDQLNRAHAVTGAADIIARIATMAPLGEVVEGPVAPGDVPSAPEPLTAAGEVQPAKGPGDTVPGEEPAAPPAGTLGTPAMTAVETEEKPQDKARIDARLLDEMLNNAGEVSIFHSRLEEQVGSISFNLTELGQTVSRLREQLRKLEIETEAQILHRHHGETTRNLEFDPLELDRYSGLQQLSRALAESVSDLVSLQDLMTDITRESESLLVQQARVTGELQDALIRSRMLPFERYVPRFERIVRQAAAEQHKQVALTISGGSGELDRQVLQRMLPPFEHMLRNAVIHGIEAPQTRQAAAKSEHGEIHIELVREGAEMVIRLSDDGRGLDPERIRQKAREQGLLEPGHALSDDEAIELILQHGFSTAAAITQSAGRGVGMDVVANEVKMLGGSLQVESTTGMGTTFVIRLPLTLAVSQALLVRCRDERFAIPLPAVEGIVRAPRDEIDACLREDNRRFVHDGNQYTVRHLGPFLSAPPVSLEQMEGPSIPLILIRSGERSSALMVDELLGSREVVVKSAGPMIAGITGITGATILGDGSIVVILDVGALIRNRTDRRNTQEYVVAETSEDLRPVVLVVDDSITVRRVTQRLLERNGMRVLLAKDGVDAVAVMQEIVPDLVLLDIEMPRMDGYEVASHIRNTDPLQHVPITMITSRVGDKHRARAFELGVDKYLGKPYQENQLLDVIHPLLARSVKHRK